MLQSQSKTEVSFYKSCFLNFYNHLGSFPFKMLAKRSRFGTWENTSLPPPSSQQWDAALKFPKTGESMFGRGDGGNVSLTSTAEETSHLHIHPPGMTASGWSLSPQGAWTLHSKHIWSTHLRWGCHRILATVPLGSFPFTLQRSLQWLRKQEGVCAAI